MIIFLMCTGDNIQKQVEMETSLLAERRRREFKDGTSEELLDELVMDEEYEILFKRLFNEGGAEVVKGISSNYLVGTPTDMEAVWREFPDFSQDRDFYLWLNMHDDFVLQYKKSIQVKLQQFLIDYVCWRWLETKSPDDAKTYLARLGVTMGDIQKLLIRKERPLRRLPSFP
jgi:hypothetical protein